jgi:hypothetical protein
MITAADVNWGLFQAVRTASELLVPNFTPPHWWEADLFRITRDAMTIEYEVKLSLADYNADRRKAEKHARLMARDAGCPNRFIYVVPADIAHQIHPPHWAGLMTVTEGCRTLGFEVIRKAPRLHKVTVSDEVRRAAMMACHGLYWTSRWHLREALKDKRALELFA